MNKKKVGIVTILDVANFGTMLQAYALATIIEQMGFRIEFLNYWRHDYTTFHKVCTFLKDKSLGSIFKRSAFALSALLFYPIIRGKVRNFVTQKFNFTRTYHSLDNILQSPPDWDIAICGSDQIWNSIYNGGIDKTFYLDFADCPRIAYAASVGMKEFPSEETPSIKKILSTFDAISVREKQTCDYLHNLGLKATHVLDPTLLLTKDQWKAIADCKLTDAKKEKYLLVYSVERFNNDLIFSQAKHIAQELHLKMYVISTTYPVKAKDYGFDKIYPMAGVKTFLRLMADADFIVASSFHGTAFALNFNKEFITISANKFNIRMESLIEQFNIKHRIVNNIIVSAADLSPIDYVKLNKKLDQERVLSMSFLSNNLTSYS